MLHTYGTMADVRMGDGRLAEVSALTDAYQGAFDVACIDTNGGTTRSVVDCS
mgnify:FL=1